MANRYWVGGTGSWTTTNTVNWSTTSGGTGGASVPTAADSVFFDQAGTYTVTLTGALTCLDFNVTAGTLTFTSTGTISIAGTMSISNVTPTWSGTGAVSFTATTTGKTITTNGVSFACAFVLAGTGGGWTLGSSLSIQGLSCTVAATFDTAGYNISCQSLGFSGALARTLYFRSSTITVSSAGTTFGTNITLDAGTSTIVFTYANAVTQTMLTASNYTFNNIVFSPISPGAGAITTRLISGSGNTFNNISASISSASVTGIVSIAFNGTNTINGNITNLNSDGRQRVLIASYYIGLQMPIVMNGTLGNDLDFRDICMISTNPVSGTRIGDHGGNTGITFSAPKTVYWVANTTNANYAQPAAWSNTLGGVGSNDFFPLPQDTAVITNSSTTTTINITNSGSIITAYLSNIDLSARTNALTFNFAVSATLMGHWEGGSGVSITGTSTLTLSGRNLQTIQSAGKTFTTPIVIDSYGGTVQLADAFVCNGSGFTLTNGTFITNNYSLTVPTLASNNTNVRAMYLGSSLVTCSGSITFNSTANLIFNAGTSAINIIASGWIYNTTAASTLNFNEVYFTSSAGYGLTGAGTINVNTLKIDAYSGVGTKPITFTSNSTIGTLSILNSSVTRRVLICPETAGNRVTLNIGTITGTDIDFRDVTITGGAVNTSITRGGDCGGNVGLLFPSPKTVYWNLAGAQDWSSAGWATTSGGSPSIDNFPLAQDTAIFDNASAITTIRLNEQSYNVGTIDMSSRTTAMTFACTQTTYPVCIYGDFKLGTGVSCSVSTAYLYFYGRGTQNIITNGVTVGNRLLFGGSNIVLGSSLTLSSANFISLWSGSFDANGYNVTTLSFESSNTNVRLLKMGSGTWTLTGTASVWTLTTSTNLSLYKGTANIVLSDNTTTSRIFAGGASLHYNKLTIGGNTSTSTTTIQGTPIFSELASTKTVAHTLTFGTMSVGLWSISGSASGTVTVSGTTLNLWGSRVSTVNYLAMGTTSVTTTSTVEFYTGSSGSGTGAGVIVGNANAATTRYWVGGTGTWDATTTTHWSTTSGGAGGASVPTSADTVIFDSASAAAGAAYTVTLTATMLRCGSLNVSGTTGGVTFAGTAPLSITQSCTIASTGVTRTYTGAIYLSGTGTGKTFSSGQTLASTINMYSIDGEWSLGSNITTTTGINLYAGTFNTANYTLSCGLLTVPHSFSEVGINFGSSSISCTGLNLTNSTYTILNANLSFNAGTSNITFSTGAPTTYFGNYTFYNVNFTNNNSGDISIYGFTNSTITVNNLTFAAYTIPTASIKRVFIQNGNLIVNGVLAFTNTSPVRRVLFQSGMLLTQRTVTANSITGLSDVDIRDIAGAGAASWAGTRLGDCGGNSNITFDAPKTVYAAINGSGIVWSSVMWKLTPGGVANVNNFPLAQDTAIVTSDVSTYATPDLTFDAQWNVGTMDYSGVSQYLNLSFSASLPYVHTCIKLSSYASFLVAGSAIFYGRGTQQYLSAGKQIASIFVYAGTVELLDAVTLTSTMNVVAGGTFNAGAYNVTATIANLNGTTYMGSGTWTLTSTGTVWSMNGVIDKGTANIVLSSTVNSAVRTFAGGGGSYNKLTIGGATGTSTQLNFTSNNRFTEITSTKTVAHTISLSSSVQYTDAFTVSGSAGNLVTITGSSITVPAAIVYTGTGVVNTDYCTVLYTRMYRPSYTWYIGANSRATSLGTLGLNYSSMSYNAHGKFFAFF